MCEFIYAVTELSGKVPSWSSSKHNFTEPLEKRTVVELLHLQNPYFCIFANVSKMPKEIKKNLKRRPNTYEIRPIKSVLKRCQTFSENYFIKLIFFTKLALFGCLRRSKEHCSYKNLFDSCLCNYEKTGFTENDSPYTVHTSIPKPCQGHTCTCTSMWGGNLKIELKHSRPHFVY